MSGGGSRAAVVLLSLFLVADTPKAGREQQRSRLLALTRETADLLKQPPAAGATGAIGSKP